MSNFYEKQRIKCYCVSNQNEKIRISGSYNERRGFGKVDTPVKSWIQEGKTQIPTKRTSVSGWRTGVGRYSKWINTA